MKVAIVGATGAVGSEMLKTLEKRKFPVEEIVPFASEKSKGKKVRFKDREFESRVLEPGCFKGVDFAFFDASDEISKEWAPQAAESKAWVVDNAATFRMDPESLLIVPEVNGATLKEKLKSEIRTAKDRIVVGPNCSTAQLVLPLKAISDEWGLERVVVSTYQATNGGGAKARQELENQSREVLSGKTPSKPENFPHQIAFNCIPHIGGFKENGYTSEEMKMINESKKILGLPELKITVTAVRVPTLVCHGESVNVETKKDFDVQKIRDAFSSFEGIEIQDEIDRQIYPLGIHGEGQDPVYIGRIRRDESINFGVNFWIISDNLRKGAALNAVQIGEIILGEVYS